jgi:hypothetical protein
VYDLNYTPITLAGGSTKLKRNNIWGYTNKNVEYHRFRGTTIHFCSGSASLKRKATAPAILTEIFMVFPKSLLKD